MIQRWLACLLVVALLSAQVAAQPDPTTPPPPTTAPVPPASVPPASTLTVMVLPLEGDADAELRTKLTGLIEAGVKDLGTVKAGTTTFGETAAALGCEPATSSCAESVRTTVAVDVLIYGTATTKDGNVEVVIRKKEKDKDPVEHKMTIATTGEPQLDPVAMRDIVGQKPLVCEGDNELKPDGSCGPKPGPAKRKVASTTKILMITAFAGAGLLMLGGLTQWNEKSKKQDDIDDAPTDTLAQLQALERLEESAGKNALYGNLLVLGALGAGAVGYWLYRKDKKERASVMVTPTATPTSAGVLITIGAY